MGYGRSRKISHNHHIILQRCHGHYARLRHYKRKKFQKHRKVAEKYRRTRERRRREIDFG